MDNLLSSIGEYMTYAPGMDASLDIDNLRPSNFNARRTIKSVIGNKVFNALAESDAANEQRIALSGSLANLTMYNYKVFDAVNKRVNQGKEIYRYELDAMRREYINNHFTYIDALIGLLENNTDFKESDMYKLKESLIIKTLDQFESYYPIDGSYYFFYRTLPLQRNIIEEQITSTINLTDACANAKHKRKVEKAIVLFTISSALQMFDVYELPSNIKNTGSANRISTDKLYDEKWVNARVLTLEKEASQLIADIERVQSAVKNNESTPLNGDNDKSFLML